MEESSEAHMETDVSSTTDDVPEAPKEAVLHSNIETVIVVETVKEENESPVNSGSKQSTPSTSTNSSPQKPATPQKLPKPANFGIDVPKKLNSSSDCLKTSIKPQTSSKASPEKHQPESSDSSKKVESSISPRKTPEKTDKSPIKVTPIQNVQNISFKDIKVTKSPKLIRIREIPKINVVSSQEKSPSKDTLSKPDKEVTLLKLSNKEVKLPETSLKLVVSPEKNKLQESASDRSPKKDDNSKMQSEKVSELNTSKVVEKSPIEKQQSVISMEVIKAKNTEENSKKTDTKNDEILESVAKVSSNEVSMSENGLEESQSSQTNICEADSIRVHGKDKTDSSEPLEESTDQNDSQSSMEVDKDHNKSISRELKSLINSAKESKIISECTQLTSKTRKSRSQLDTSNSTLNTSLEADKVRMRRNSNLSQVSNSSEKSEKGQKRSMRSQNPEFASKYKMFMNAIASKVAKDSDEAMSDDDTPNPIEKRSMERSKSTPPSSKKKKVSEQPATPKQKIQVPDDKKSKLMSDIYCWRCHWIVEQEEDDKAHPPVHCTVCPRSFHYKCLSGGERKTAMEKSWVCPDCLTILNAEGSDTRSAVMKKTSLGTLCDLLKYALGRMMDLNGVEAFLQPVDRTQFPDYDKYVVHPMDLSQMKQNIADGLYGSTEAFVADAQWILHNSIIFNTLQSKLTSGAKALVRSCRAEMGEIEACPECYAAAHARRATWFTDVCTTPHVLLWAKLKGFPYWPAKAMSVNSSGLVDVRFFGAHDRAWVPAKDCFLFSERDPNNFRTKRQDILDSMQEAEQHIRNISRKYGKFVYPPFKTLFDPTNLTEQLKLMIPSFEGEVKTVKQVYASPLSKAKRRSISKGSKSSVNDGDGSESEDASSSARTEAIKIRKTTETNNTPTKVDSPAVSRPSPSDEVLVTRKRRRSNLEEAVVLTVIETSSPLPEKKKRADKPEQQEPSSSKEDKAHSTTKDSETTTKKKPESAKSKSKDEEPSSSTQDTESLRVTPIKLVALPRTNKQTPKLFAATKSPTTPKEDDKTLQKTKPNQEKGSISEKSKEDKAKKRRNSRANKSLNDSATKPKTADKKDSDASEKEAKENKKKETDDANKSDQSKSEKASKDRLTFDDDTSLAVIARERRRSNANLPTISSVVSLSTTAQASLTNNTPTTSTSQIVVASSDSNIFTPTSTSAVTNMKDAVTKLQKLRDNTEPVVGRVGVRAFARMSSPSREKSHENMEVEIKAEPIEMEEDERLSEKMDLMKACKLQPVQTLRDVRISRVVSAKKAEARPRARKTFPQPRASEARSELNGKNTMVYIPIQPPATQPPVRAPRPVPHPPRHPAPPTVYNAVNTVTTPLKPTTTHSSPISVPTAGQVSVPTVGTVNQVSVPTVGQVSQVNVPSVSISQSLSSVGPILPTAGQMSVPTVGQVPTTVHTVPLMTSVNGQWMFSLQPVMSVGGVDNSNPGGLVNGCAAPGMVPVHSAASATLTPIHNRTNTEKSPNELPRLQQRPTLAQTLEGAVVTAVPVPPAAGPITAKLHQNAQKLTELFRALLEESLEEVHEPSAAATGTALRLQLEQARWKHAAELDEMRCNHELTLAEMRLSFEKEKLRVANETRRTAQAELDAAVKVAKSKQWCANCSQEAQLYCCWNTAYCDYPCQRAHWPAHYTHCAQRQQDGSIDETGATDLQMLPEIPSLQKSNQPATAALTVGGKLTTTRVFPTQDSAQKTSIIVSMVEDTSGNQTMKCVGTYKPTGTQQGMPPLIINKQMVSEETAKKVVTSGGYLIVGAGNNASIITPGQARRPNTIQYFTTAYNYPMADKPDEPMDLTDLPLPSKSNAPVETQDAAASTSATQFAEPPTIAAPKSSAQRQREYRQRIALSRTPAQSTAMRISDTERKRNYRLRKAANLALASGSLESTTASSSRSARRLNDVQNST